MSGAAPIDDRDDDPVLAWVDADELTRTPLYPCPYLPGRQARQRAFLADHLAPATYHGLMDRGFRRSGQMFYAMDCPGCRQCVPLRVPVATFRATRSQRRAARKNRDVTVTVRAPTFTTATYELYCRYLAHQHPDADREENAEQFRASLYADVVDTVEVVYALDGTAIAISLLDVCRSSVSAVYHFYEPALRDRSLGVFSVLAEIDWTRRIGVPHYYLGYWIEGARTMHYKADYGPHEVLRDGRWQSPRATDSPQR